VIRKAMAMVALVALSCVLVPLVGEAPGNAATQLLGGRVHESFSPDDGKVFILVIGNDARVGNPDTTRADALHIVGINTKTQRAGIINFPRDSYLPVPGHGTMKVNESLYAGGPDLLAQTLENETGIRLDYWIMTGFVGFQKIVRDLGGVKMDVPYAIDDYGSGANLKAGVQTLEPGEALAFNRSRKTLPNGDIDRSTNQGLFLLALLEQLQAETENDPASILKWMSIARKWTRLDIPPDEMFTLGVLAAQIPRSNVKAQTVPVTIGSAGLASVVYIQPGAQDLYNRLKKTGSL
jgi:LCP family protein required for cell wall assembly